MLVLDDGRPIGAGIPGRTLSRLGGYIVKAVVVSDKRKGTIKRCPVIFRETNVNEPFVSTPERVEDRRLRFYFDFPLDGGIVAAVILQQLIEPGVGCRYIAESPPILFIIDHEFWTVVRIRVF